VLDGEVVAAAEELAADELAAEELAEALWLGDGVAEALGVWVPAALDAAVGFRSFGPMKKAAASRSTTTAALTRTHAMPRRLDSTAALERCTPWRRGASGTSSNSSRG
jgi:hypothetical protein